jgi:hypothetical protein
MPVNCNANNRGLCISDSNGMNCFSGVVIDIALMAEDMPEIHQDCSTTRYLAPIDVTWNQFHNLFYFNNGGFTPNTSLGCLCPFDSLIGHGDKTISDAGGRNKDYVLMNELLEHYTEHLEESPLCWDVCSRVEFEKKVSAINSLFDVGICNVKCSMSLDEFFSSMAAHGVDIDANTGMPTLAAQKKKVVALVTTKFVSQNTGDDHNVPDLNIGWPFRVDFRACIASPMGRGCCSSGLGLDVTNCCGEQRGCCMQCGDGPCEKNLNSCNPDAYGVNDVNCQRWLDPSGSSLTHPCNGHASLLDLGENCAAGLTNLPLEEEIGACAFVAAIKKEKGVLCPCIYNLDISQLCSETTVIAGGVDIKPERVLSPWGCVDWCPGDRYLTSYQTANWVLSCVDCAVDVSGGCLDCDASGVTDCTTVKVDECLPGLMNCCWRWHQKCSDDSGTDCYNIIGCQQFCPPTKNPCCAPSCNTSCGPPCC